MGNHNLVSWGVHTAVTRILQADFNIMSHGELWDWASLRFRCGCLSGLQWLQPTDCDWAWFCSLFHLFKIGLLISETCMRITSFFSAFMLCPVELLSHVVTCHKKAFKVHTAKAGFNSTPCWGCWPRSGRKALGPALGTNMPGRHIIQPPASSNRSQPW